MLEVVLIEYEIHSVDLTWLEISHYRTTVHLISVSVEVCWVILAFTNLLDDVQKMKRCSSVATCEEVVSNVDVYRLVLLCQYYLRAAAFLAVEEVIVPL